MRIQGNAPWRSLRERTQKSRHFLTVTGNKEYVCPYRFDINRKILLSGKTFMSTRN